MGNRLTDLLGIEIPILQAPMTFIARAGLAAAVSEAGALGVIETASDGGRADLRAVRALTDKPVGANVALLMMRDPDVVDVLVDAGIRFVTTSAGDPALFTDRLHDAGLTVFHVVGTMRAAHKAVDAGVDGLVVEGVEGGGFKNLAGASTMVLLPMVATAFDLPIVAAGGICDARSMAAAMVLGADGVQMGTRMLASAESPVHDNFKAAIVGADDTATVLLALDKMPTMRVIRTGAAERCAASGAWEFDGGLTGVERLYRSGDMECSLANTGQVAGRITDVRPVAGIIREMWTGCLAAIEAGRRRLGSVPA
ncbi:MAG TPA: nitronate monooxygenase [Acidimicrobiia bacterium]|nr:nitronate monooxygenase [Acidimicrobiia bacterium]